MRPTSQIEKELEQDFGSAWSYYPDKAMEVGLSLVILLDVEKAEVRLWKERHGKQLEHSAELTGRVDSLTSENVKLLAERRRLTDEASRNGGMLFHLIESMSGHDQMRYVGSYLMSWYQRQKRDRETPEERRMSEAEAAKLQRFERLASKNVEYTSVPGGGFVLTAESKAEVEEYKKLRDEVKACKPQDKKTDTVPQSECVRTGVTESGKVWEELPAIDAESDHPPGELLRQAKNASRGEPIDWDKLDVALSKAASQMIEAFSPMFTAIQKMVADLSTEQGKATDALSAMFRKALDKLSDEPAESFKPVVLAAECGQAVLTRVGEEEYELASPTIERLQGRVNSWAATGHRMTGEMQHDPTAGMFTQRVKKRDTSTTVEHKPAEPTEPVEPVKSPAIETIVVTGKTVLDLDFFIDRQKRFGYTTKGAKEYDFDNTLWMQVMEWPEGRYVDIEASKFIPKYIEFDINAATQSAIHAAISQQKLVGCEQMGPPVFDSQENRYTVRMRKSPQAR